MGKLAQERRIKARRDEARGGLSVIAYAKQTKKSKRDCARLVRSGRHMKGPWVIA